MQEAVDEVLARRREPQGGLSRALSTSMLIHFGLAFALLVIPKNFWAREQTKPLVMTISLGGSGGNRSGGMVAASARPVEQVAPPPKRSEPIPPATPPKASSVNLMATKPVAKTPTPAPSATPTAPPRPPTTGAQTRPGTAVAETGSKALSDGLTFGGAGAGDTSVRVETTFCCPEYIGELQRRILAIWKPWAPESGAVTVVFEVQRDGTFTPPVIEKSGGVVLDAASLLAFQGLHLQPLPKEFTEPHLKIHMTFPYGK
jgi:outer membrane biosynthesis protein TonB